MYAAVGRLLARSVFDERPVPARFAPSLWKHLLGLPPTFSDLRSFDPVEARSMRSVLEMRPEDVEHMMLDFDGLKPGGADVAVTATNRNEFIELRTKHVLLGSRKRRLDAIKRGFGEHKLVSALRMLSFSELVGVVCGRQDVTGAMIEGVLRFTGFPAESPMPGRFRKVVRSLSPELASSFLLYVTALAAMPAGGARIQIERCAASGRLPVAHTCFRRLDLCDDDASEEEMKLRLTIALERVDDAGFGIA